MTFEGVIKRTITKGDGKTFPKPGDTVEMHYNGHALSKSADGANIIGRKIDSSLDRKQIFRTIIGAGKVIPGWDEGVPQMSLGEKASLEISAEFGYSDSGFPNLIKPNEMLYFEVELLKINEHEASGYPVGTLSPVVENVSG